MSLLTLSPGSFYARITDLKLSIWKPYDVPCIAICKGMITTPGTSLVNVTLNLTSLCPLSRACPLINWSELIVPFSFNSKITQAGRFCFPLYAHPLLFWSVIPSYASSQWWLFCWNEALHPIICKSLPISEPISRWK